MRVQEYAEKHCDRLLSLMTPDGFLRIQAKELLTAERVKTNPGCSGVDADVSAKDILKMVVIEARDSENAINMLVERVKSA